MYISQYYMIISLWSQIINNNNTLLNVSWMCISTLSHNQCLNFHDEFATFYSFKRIRTICIYPLDGYGLRVGSRVGHSYKFIHSINVHSSCRFLTDWNVFLKRFPQKCLLVKDSVHAKLYNSSCWKEMPEHNAVIHNAQ